MTRVLLLLSLVALLACSPGRVCPNCAREGLTRCDCSQELDGLTAETRAANERAELTFVISVMAVIGCLGILATSYAVRRRRRLRAEEEAQPTL